MAARAEFERHGYDGTNTNEIARSAGYVPQTFYRHFSDKCAVFIAVYEHWVQEELALLSNITSAEAAADILISHHRQHRVFRRSLRVLTATNSEVAMIRAKMRLQQVKNLSDRLDRFASLDLAEQLAAILRIERLCDAAADGEFNTCGVSDGSVRSLIVACIQDLGL